jgi:MarR family transcriptional regulator, lower aerobic nicotinate degradation pathway regulator
MYRLGMQFKALAMEALTKAGFSQYEYGVLAVLDEQPRETQAAIAEALDVDRSQLVRILDGLEERGLVARRRDEDDRRRHVVTVTATGRRQLRRLRETFDRLEEELVAPLDAHSRQTLHALLLRVADYHNPGCADDSLPEA